MVLLLILILVKGVEKLEGWKEDGSRAAVGRKRGARACKPEREIGLASVTKECEKEREKKA